MKMLLSKKIFVFILVTILVTSFACITVTGDSTAEPTDQDTNVTDGIHQEVLTLEEQINYGTGEFNFTDPVAGLSNLPSYQATLVLSFDGTHDGNPESWSTTYVILTTTQPAARSITVDSNKDSKAFHMLELEMDGLQYKKSGEQDCTARLLEENKTFNEPASFLTGVVGAEEAGSDSINNIVSNHYTFDQLALGEEGITESAGELWVAPEGGYLVKYLLTQKANANYFGEGIEGTLTWDYQLGDINAVGSIELPNDCPPAIGEIPLLPDATNVQKFIGLIEYQTVSLPADVAAFYQEQIPALGWALDNSGLDDKSGFLMFTQSNKVLIISFEVKESITKVRMLVSLKDQ